MSSFREKAQLYHDLSAMHEAGLLLTDALKLGGTGTFQKSIKTIRQDILERSSTLSDAMRKHPAVFTKMECDLVALGEQSGMLTRCFANLGKWYRLLDRVRSEIQSGMIYPMLVLHLAPVLLGLPGLVSGNGLLNYLRDIIIALIPIYLVLFFFLYFLPRSRERVSPVAELVDRLALRIPILGPAVWNLNMARYSLSLSYAIDSGMDIHGSLQIATATSKNVVIRRRLQGISKLVRGGKSLVEAFRTSRFDDGLVENFIGVGEQSGKQVEMLQKLHEYYFNKFHTSMVRFTKVFPVIVLLLVGVLIAIKLLAAYKALWQMPL